MASIEKTEVKIRYLAAEKNNYFVASGEVLVFDGFLKVYGGGKDDSKSYHRLEQGQKLQPEDCQRIAKSYSRPPAPLR